MPVSVLQVLSMMKQTRNSHAVVKSLFTNTLCVYCDGVTDAECRKQPALITAEKIDTSDWHITHVHVTSCINN